MKKTVLTFTALDNEKNQIIDRLILKNIKGGSGCPPPIRDDVIGTLDDA